MNIRINGARENNLRGIDIEFGDGLSVVTGVSGSGKSSLVFSTLYHEARRRFIDIFARGSSPRLAPAKVQEITGLGPTVAIEQNILNRNPLSSLATASGLHPFLRLLFANFGERHCPKCGYDVRILTLDEFIDFSLQKKKTEVFRIYAPLVNGVRGSHITLLQWLVEEFGKEKILVDGSPYQSEKLNPNNLHNIEVEIAKIDESVSTKKIRDYIRLITSLGAQTVKIRTNQTQFTFSFTNVCSNCGTWFQNIKPIYFRTPCQFCKGKGCEQCQKTGLYPEAAAVIWKGLRFPDLLALSVDEVFKLFTTHDLPSSADRLVFEIDRRLKALKTVGLDYISLDRSSPTLSRGESQRVRLAVALTSRLEDIIHVLDEPTIGLSITDVNNLLPAFRQLHGPVIFVEHDRVAAAAADRAIDLGPGAGRQGGQVIFTGTPAALWETDTLTGRFFSKRDLVEIPKPRPKPNQFIVVEGANLRNLQNINISIPISRLTVITGPSGSGKSTFVEDVLFESLSKKTLIGCKRIKGPSLKPILVDQSPIGKNSRSNPATYTKLAAIIRDIFANSTDFSPSHFSFNRPEGACPECKGMGAIEVKMRYLPSTWITCAICEGKRFSEEVLAAKVDFEDQPLSIADFYKLSVDDVIEKFQKSHKIQLTKTNQRSAKGILEALQDIGLGYLQLGQPSPTLSGGEAQRVKLAKYLGMSSLKNRLIILDEPSTGLHPHDVAGLLLVLDRLVKAGATIVVVEHNSDFIRAADWIIDLGPEAGPDGGQLIFDGSPTDLMHVKDSLTATGLKTEESIYPHSEMVANGKKPTNIRVKNATAHNLKNVTIEFPKASFTVVTGVSGSGKSSLISNVLKSEAERRFLETLSLYERQGMKEGPEAPVEAVSGLGVTISLDPSRIGGRWYNYRSTVGVIAEISHHLALLLSNFGEYTCQQCGTLCQRKNQEWICPSCNTSTHIPEARYFSPSNYASACTTCHGVGSIQTPKPEKLIIHPSKPLCKGAMYSPGFFPKGYLCKPYNGGYYVVQALAEHYNFDPFVTPWDQMSNEAQQAFLFGDPQPLQVTFKSRNRPPTTRTIQFGGFYGWIRDWDVGGTYSQTQVCATCQGTRFRPEYLAVTIGGFNIHELSEMPFKNLLNALENISFSFIEYHIAYYSLQTLLTRLRFLIQVGLGYLHCTRVVMTLSAGEAQRIRLAGLLGSQMTSLTLLIDEPTRGLHPSEVDGLLEALTSLRDEKNTIIVVEHDPQVIRAADYVIDIGPGPGVAGGQIIAQGTPNQVAMTDTTTALWLRGERRFTHRKSYRMPKGWVKIYGACENNLRGDLVELPLGVLIGLCGVSGSGKSTLLIDTLGRVLAPKKHTTSVANEPLEPGKYNTILGAEVLQKTMVIDQSQSQISSPLNYFELKKPLFSLYATSEDFIALDMDEKLLSKRCAACRGRGQVKIAMGFLPDVYTICETCQGTGLIPEAQYVRLYEYTLPELFNLTLDQIYELFSNEDKIARPLQAAKDVGLGYLILKQPGITLSGGECQRMKIAKELYKNKPPKTKTNALYILDEPTVGQHMEDIARLIGMLNRLVDEGHTVVVIEHHPNVLAACDWLIELGPEGGLEGGRVIAAGTPDEVAKGTTPTAPYLRAVLEEA